MRRLLEVWVQEPKQARGRYDGDRRFIGAERRCCSRPSRARALYPVASTSETPGGCGAVALAMGTVVLAQSSTPAAIARRRIDMCCRWTPDATAVGAVVGGRFWLDADAPR
jgi:hypothetical protein